MLAIVNHHYIRPSFEQEFPSIYGITPEKFEEELTELGKWGEFVSQKSLKAAIQNTHKLADRSILLTFDDGLQEQYSYALPILQKLNIPAVFFISSKILESNKILNVHKIHLIRSKISNELLATQLVDFLKQKNIDIDLAEAGIKGKLHYKFDAPDSAEIKYIMNFLMNSNHLNEFIEILFKNIYGNSEEEIFDSLYMSKKQIQGLGNLNYVGSHSHEHVPLSSLDKKSLQGQVLVSKKELENVTKHEVYGFSYPYGNLGSCQGAGPILDECGFVYSLTTKPGINMDLSDPFYLMRFDNNELPGGKSYKFKSNNFFEEYALENPLI